MIQLLRRTLRLGMLGGIGYGLWRRLWGRNPADTWADSWVSTGPAGATVPAAAPVPPAPAPGEAARPVAASPAPPAPDLAGTPPPAAAPAPPAPGSVTGAPVLPATTEAPGTNGEAVHTPPGSDEPADGNGRVSAGGAGGEAPGPSRPVTPRLTKPSRTGPARRTPTGKVAEPPGERLWVAASDGVCPPSHPVKAKLASKIFHLPGARNYSRTHADRCYPDEESAVADGLRQALR
jgi:hypothetical protein